MYRSLNGKMEARNHMKVWSSNYLKTNRGQISAGEIILVVAYSPLPMTTCTGF